MFNQLLVHWFLQVVAMVLTALLVPNFKITGLFGGILIVAALALINATIWDAALFLSIPDSLSVHALLLLLTNGLIFYVLVKILPGIEVEGILPALIAPVVFTILSLVVYTLAREVDWPMVGEEASRIALAVRQYFLAQQAAPE